MFKNWQVSEEIKNLLINSRSIFIPGDRDELIELALGGKENDIFYVEYIIDKNIKREATVIRCKNGLAVNYGDIYIRRRDPDCLYIGDENYSDKPKFNNSFPYKFSEIRSQTLNWLKEQDLIVMPFLTGGNVVSYNCLFIGPKNAAFFALAIADLQQILDISNVEDNYKPEILLILAPVFRHTHFNGKQVVVHNRREDIYEIFSYNLYPGPSAKKGLYGALLYIGERERWLTLHASSVKIQTPYENTICLLHESASGGGKSEINEEIERREDGHIILGKNILTDESITVYLKEECKIFPITDDMTLAHTSLQKEEGKLTIADAEKAWFVRVDHIKSYGTNPVFEKMCIQPPKPILFLNIYAVPKATCLIWEHIEDEPGKPCPNPRVIFPRNLVHNVINEPTAIDYRSFGIRTPPTFKGNNSYGIFGFMHILPPAIAWLYRLAAPRGYDNPSIIKTSGLTSEGIGTYGPFLTGSIINHANLLLEQFIKNIKVQYLLFPNQYVGCWYVGFMPEWIGREYLSRRGNRPFIKEELIESKHSLLGYTKKTIKVEDIIVPEFLLRVELQPEIDNDTFNKGIDILYEFFKQEVKKYDKPDLMDIGKKIIQCLFDNGKLEDFEDIIRR